jgi:hypothetical protein
MTATYDPTKERQMAKRVPAKNRDQASLDELATDVMDLVAKVAGRRLKQTLEMIHEEYIEPRDKRIAELEAKVQKLGGTI